MGVVLLNRMVRAGLIEKMTSEQRLEGDEGISHSAYLGEKRSRQREQPAQRS